MYINDVLFLSIPSGERGNGKTTSKPLHYKDTPIHRVVKDFIIQGGDFSAGKTFERRSSKIFQNVIIEHTVFRQICMNNDTICDLIRKRKSGSWFFL